MGGGTVPRGQFHHVRAMPCHRRMLLRSGVRQETASRSGATNGRQASCEIHRMSYSSFVYNCVGRRPAASASPSSRRKEKMRTIFIVPVLLAAFAEPAWSSQRPRRPATAADLLRHNGGGTNRIN